MSTASCMKFCLLAVASVLLAGAAAFAADFPGTIVLGRPTNKSVAANLVAPSALSTYLEYGTQSGAYPAQIDPVTLTANAPQEVTINALAANTRYYYRIRFRATNVAAYDASPEYSFMTARAP